MDNVKVGDVVKFLNYPYRDCDWWPGLVLEIVGNEAKIAYVIWDGMADDDPRKHYIDCKISELRQVSDAKTIKRTLDDIKRYKD